MKIILNLSIIIFLILISSTCFLISIFSNHNSTQLKSNIRELNEKEISNIDSNIDKEMANFENREKQRHYKLSKQIEEMNIKKWEYKEYEKKINNKGINIHKKNKNIISCAFALDNAYIYPTLVALESLVDNAKNNSFYDIYVLIDINFSIENIKILKTIEKNYTSNCEIIFKILDDKYSKEKTDKRIKIPSYYRLELHNLLPNVNKIIWLDGDTGVFEDLTELYNIDMKGNYILGFLDSIPEAVDRYGIKNSTVLCAGVLLMDLEALRVNRMTEKFDKFLNDYRDGIDQHDQTIINVVCQGKISKLPPKYGIWCFEGKKHAIKHNKRQRTWLQYNDSEFLNAYFHPGIMHFVWPKPYWRKKKPVFNKEWWNYAKKTGFYSDIWDKSPKYVKW